jgi:hypothetical protein
MKSGPSVSPPGCVLHVFSEKKSSPASKRFPAFFKYRLCFSAALQNKYATIPDLVPTVRTKKNFFFHSAKRHKFSDIIMDFRNLHLFRGIFQFSFLKIAEISPKYVQ